MNALEHLAQKPVWPLQVGGLDLTVTNGVVTVWLAALIVFGCYFYLSRRLTLVPGRAQNLAEAVIFFLRDEVAVQIGRGRDAWLPFLIALFSFILANNLLGLVPAMSSATGNINTTAALALTVFVVVQAAGIASHGPAGYFRSLIPPGVPLAVAIFLVPVEIISQLAKPFSLAVRLFANMFAGHAVMLMLLSLIFVFKSYLVLPLPVIGNTLVLAFEIFVALIQAFIFTYLSALYIATALEGH
ncbi:MAG: F0F1 ATP synthase subunit A [Candidatus Saganbacteria bacterium]|nr:F0F1 ATP synthase subunit A [Candidatus Saganbacteria bacterium]